MLCKTPKVLLHKGICSRRFTRVIRLAKVNFCKDTFGELLGLGALQTFLTGWSAHSSLIDFFRFQEADAIRANSDEA
jgi:hypothetical protein